MLSLQISGNPDTCIQMQQVDVIGGSNFMDDAKACFNALFMEIVLAVGSAAHQYCCRLSTSLSPVLSLRGLLSWMLDVLSSAVLCVS